MDKKIKSENSQRIKSRLCGWLTAAVLLSACGSPAETPLTIKPGEWKAVFQVNGKTVSFPVKIMNIYLVEEEYESQYPEAFEIVGPNIHLVGTFPMDLRVGYEEDLNRLLEQPIFIKIQLGNAEDYGIESSYSTIEMPGDIQRYIKSGRIDFKKLTGKNGGQEGDRTLSGEIIITFDSDDGLQTITGQISVHAVSWG